MAAKLSEGKLELLKVDQFRAGNCLAGKLFGETGALSISRGFGPGTMFYSFMRLTFYPSLPLSILFLAKMLPDAFLVYFIFVCMLPFYHVVLFSDLPTVRAIMTTFDFGFLTIYFLAGSWAWIDALSYEPFRSSLAVFTLAIPVYMGLFLYTSSEFLRVLEANVRTWRLVFPIITSYFVLCPFLLFFDVFPDLESNTYTITRLGGKDVLISNISILFGVYITIAVFFAKYGFALWRHPHDHIVLKVRKPLGTPFAQMAEEQ